MRIRETHNRADHIYVGNTVAFTGQLQADLLSIHSCALDTLCEAIDESLLENKEDVLTEEERSVISSLVIRRCETKT